MAACPQVETMTLKASGRGPALILFTAFALLLSGGAFLVLSTALSVGVLSPAKALTVDYRYQVSHLTGFVRNHRKPKQAAGSISRNTEGNGREKWEREQAPEGEEGEEALESGKASEGTKVLGNSFAVVDETSADEVVGKGTGSESSEAADLMLPSDGSAQGDLPKSEAVLEDGTRVGGESAAGVTAGRTSMELAGLDQVASASLAVVFSAEGKEKEERSGAEEAADETGAGETTVEGYSAGENKGPGTRAEETGVGGTRAGEDSVTREGEIGLGGTRVGKDTVTRAEGGRMYGTREGEAGADESESSGEDMRRATARLDETRASEDLTSEATGVRESSLPRLRGMKDQIGLASMGSENKPVAITNLTIEATLESISNPSLSLNKKINGVGIENKVSKPDLVSATDVVSKSKGKRRKGPDAEELFENFLNAKALAVDGREEKRPVSKIAFLFLTRGPLFHERLWQRFFQGNENRYSIYVHASTEGFVYNETTSKAPVFHDRQIKSIKVTWGGLNMVRAERRLLAYALMDRSNERFVLVSESCIPLRTFDYTYNYLFALEKSFISSFPTRWRYKDAFAPLVQGKDWRKGAQWFTLTRKHARIVVEDVHIWKRLQSSKAQIADEHYIQTMLPMKDAAGVVPRPLTYAAWIKRKANHPRTFVKSTTSLADIREIQGMTRPVEEDSTYGKNRHVFDECSETGTLRPCYLFARKFTKDTTRILLGLADDLWSEPQAPVVD